MYNKLVIISTLVILTTFVCKGQYSIPLYQGNIPDSYNTANEEYSEGKDLAVFKVTRPELTVYLPSGEREPGPAVIICPGGGYGSLVINREGHEIARLLSANGVAAFVLKYRLPNEKTMIDRSMGPLQDAQQAIKFVRQNARNMRLDPQKIGIMGFSAGGHLAASAGIVRTENIIENKEKIKLRPDFMILIYPVVSMDTLLGHKGSTYNLLGNPPASEKIKAFSLHLQVTNDTPPCFIAVAQDDDTMPGSLALFKAMKDKDISCEMHIYSKGGHGFLKYPALQDWGGLCIKWLQSNNWQK